MLILSYKVVTRRAVGTVADNKNFSFRHRSTSNGMIVSIVGITLRTSFK